MKFIFSDPTLALSLPGEGTKLFKYPLPNLLIIFLCLAFSCITQAAIKFPPLTGRIVDPTHVLTPEITAQLEQQLAAHEQATSNQIVVAIINDLQGYPIDDFGYQLGRAWGIGQKNKNNGVLLFIALKEKKVRIEVGYGLEGELTDAIAHNIIQTQIIPNFRQQQYAAGISQGVTAIIAALGGQYAMQKETHGSQKRLPLWAWLIIIPILFLNRRRVFLGGGFGGSGGGGFSGGGGGFGGGGASGGW